MTVPSCPRCSQRTAERSRHAQGAWWCYTCNTLYDGGTGEWDRNHKGRIRHAESLVRNARASEALAAIRATKEGAAAMTGKEPAT